LAARQEKGRAYNLAIIHEGINSWHCDKIVIEKSERRGMDGIGGNRQN
jgi:hypothetical protein